jgi:CubicO group peptidase (beta-lactamase class C family)
MDSSATPGETKARAPYHTVRQPSGGIAVVTEPNWPAFESWLSSLMQRERIPGASVGVLCRGQVIYAKGFGAADLATGRAVDPDTVQGIASVSKSFAALAVMQLVDAGLVDPYAPVSRYLPDFSLRAVPDIESIRVHHALSHTTGCPPLRRMQGQFSEFNEHLRYLADYDTTMLGRPGEHMSYCNDTFMLSAAIVERVTGRRFRDHVAERIFAPLGMRRTTYGLDEMARWPNVTKLYNLSQDKSSHEEQPWPELGTYHGGGGIRSTVLDLLRYGDMYCAGGLAPDGARVVSEAGALRMRLPVHPVGDRAYYCYALETTPAYHGVTLVEHGGSLPGVASRWGYVPEAGVSAAVLTNLGGAPADQIYAALVNAALGLPVGEPRFRPAPTFPVGTEQLDRLAGLYTADEGARIAVAREGAGLVAEFLGERYSLRMTGPDSATYSQQGAEKPVRWHLREGEPAWGIRTGVRIARRAPG